MRIHRPLIGALTALLLMVPGSVVGQDESPSAASPAPDITAALAESGFADIFPTELGGLAWDEITVLVGPESFADSDEEEVARLEALLDSLGATIDDVTTVNASRVSEDFSEFSFVSAIKVAGVEAGSTLAAFIPEFTADFTEPVQEDGQLAGKDVVIIYDATVDSFFGEAQPIHFYASGEVIWLVSAPEPLLTEALEMLP